MKTKKELFIELINEVQKAILINELNTKAIALRLKREPGLRDSFENNLVTLRHQKEAMVDQLEVANEELKICKK